MRRGKWDRNASSIRQLMIPGRADRRNLFLSVGHPGTPGWYDVAKESEARMRMHGGNMWHMVHQDESPGQLRVNRALLRRIATYAWPYRVRIAIMLGTILASSALSLIPPLLFRSLIDTVLPNHDYAR